MNRPLWRRFESPAYAPLTGDASYDVTIVGGGICGLSCAYWLKKAGVNVCVLDKGRIGSGETGSTTAHLTAVPDARLSQVSRSFGLQAAQLLWEAGAIAINTIEQIAGSHGIECDFQRVPGFLTTSLAIDAQAPAKIEALKEDERACAQLGVDAHFEREIPYFSKEGLRFPNQALFHPLRYLAGLAAQVHGAGSAIFEQSEVVEVLDEPLTVVGEGFKVRSDLVIIATHVPKRGKNSLVKASLFQTKIAPYSTYAIGAELLNCAVPAMDLWDMNDPYNYLRVSNHGSAGYAILGGYDHKTGQNVPDFDPFGGLRALLSSLLPGSIVDSQWSGQVIETHDGLPFIGQTSPKQFVATGFAGNGMTFGTFSGLMARDWVLHKSNPWQLLFSPSRKETQSHGPWNYLTENMDYPAYLLKDILFSKPEDSADDISEGEGKILLVDGKKLACFRHEDGELSLVSAICTHMGCTVRWNPLERTWDCPCHGSRFQVDGSVLGGPAEKSLPSV